MINKELFSEVLGGAYYKQEQMVKECNLKVRDDK